MRSLKLSTAPSLGSGASPVLSIRTERNRPDSDEYSIHAVPCLAALDPPLKAHGEPYPVVFCIAFYLTPMEVQSGHFIIIKCRGLDRPSAANTSDDNALLLEAVRPHIDGLLARVRPHRLAAAPLGDLAGL